MSHSLARLFVENGHTRDVDAAYSGFAAHVSASHEYLHLLAEHHAHVLDHLGGGGGKDWSQMKVAQLRNELKKLGLPVSGRKADLIGRLTGSMSQPPPTPPGVMGQAARLPLSTIQAMASSPGACEGLVKIGPTCPGNTVEYASATGPCCMTLGDKQQQMGERLTNAAQLVQWKTIELEQEKARLQMLCQIYPVPMACDPSALYEVGRKLEGCYDWIRKNAGIHNNPNMSPAQEQKASGQFKEVMGQLSKADMMYQRATPDQQTAMRGGINKLMLATPEERKSSGFWGAIRSGIATVYNTVVGALKSLWNSTLGALLDFKIKGIPVVWTAATLAATAFGLNNMCSAETHTFSTSGLFGGISGALFGSTFYSNQMAKGLCDGVTAYVNRLFGQSSNGEIAMSILPAVAAAGAVAATGGTAALPMAAASGLSRATSGYAALQASKQQASILPGARSAQAFYANRAQVLDRQAGAFQNEAYANMTTQVRPDQIPLQVRAGDQFQLQDPRTGRTRWIEAPQGYEQGQSIATGAFLPQYGRPPSAPPAGGFPQQPPGQMLLTGGGTSSSSSRQIYGIVTGERSAEAGRMLRDGGFHVVDLDAEIAAARKDTPRSINGESLSPEEYEILVNRRLSGRAAQAAAEAGAPVVLRTSSQAGATGLEALVGGGSMRVMRA